MWERRAKRQKQKKRLNGGMCLLLLDLKNYRRMNGICSLIASHYYQHRRAPAGRGLAQSLRCVSKYNSHTYLEAAHARQPKSGALSLMSGANEKLNNLPETPVSCCAVLATRLRLLC